MTAETRVSVEQADLMRPNRHTFDAERAARDLAKSTLTDVDAVAAILFEADPDVGTTWADWLVYAAEHPHHMQDVEFTRRQARAVLAADHRLAALASSNRSEGEGENPRQAALAALRAYIENAGVPLTEFNPEFVVRMMAAMMVSFHKYGRVADAYPAKFDAISDVRARMTKYRETGNRHFLVDAANFAMIEAMHTCRKDGAQWGTNDAADSPGRTTARGHRLVQEDNAGNRIMGETILHHPGEIA